jgi:hypothetical protein
MIIQINATVCAAVDHGGGRRRKIVGSAHDRRALRGQETVSDQEEQENQRAWRNAGSSNDRSEDAIAAHEGPLKIAIMIRVPLIDG